jgi:OOP family OmpA-OmpF porin
MPDEHSASPGATQAGNGGRTPDAEGAASDFAALRRLLLGPEQARLEALATEVKERKITAADIAEHLPEAIVLRRQRDNQIGRAIAPVLDTALRESVRRQPRAIAAAIFPVLGPAVRKALAEALTALVRAINNAMDLAFSWRGIKWRLESWRSGVPFAQIVIRHSLVYRVEQAFLIHAKSGLLLAHASAPGLSLPEAPVISGMLTAIQDFVRDAFRPGEGGTLRTFSVGDHTVQLETGTLALIALVIRGQAPLSLLRQQQRALEAIHLQYANALADFTGDAAPFQEACFLLEECLETVVATPQVRHGRWHWVRWAIPVAVVGGALLTEAIRSRARFDHAIALLEDEPGIIVLDAKRGLRWGDWTVTGLRDPDARPPQHVLAAAGLLPRSLTGRWEWFMSLDSAVVIARVRTGWHLPASSQLDLQNGALHVSGPVPLLAIGFMQRASLPAGVSQLILDSLSIILPAHLDSLRTAVMAERVLFAHGESIIDDVARASIRRTARRFVALHDSLMANSADVSLTLLGRTDPTGTRERNASLAQWRIDGVRAILAGEGVRAELLHELALATARPLDAPDSAQRARINRSVSFEIAVPTRLRRSN